MTMLFFVRHGAHALQGEVLAGRTDVALSPAGVEQARWLGERLAREQVSVLHTSPQQRTRETATVIAHRIGRAAEMIPALDEVNVGDWTGSPLQALDRDPRWQQWNATRSMARPPNGESMLEVQMRVIAHIERVRAGHPEEQVVLVTHADVVRAALVYYLGLDIDSFWRLEVSPGSLTALLTGQWGAKLLSLNEVMAA
jgi:probable phosphoglycerate mutase